MFQMKCLFGLSHQNRVSHRLKNFKSYVGDFVRCLDTASAVGQPATGNNRRCGFVCQDHISLRLYWLSVGLAVASTCLTIWKW